MISRNRLIKGREAVEISNKINNHSNLVKRRKKLIFHKLIRFFICFVHVTENKYLKKINKRKNSDLDYNFLIFDKFA